ncbi:MAG: DUF58 domain-containing protein [Muribaculaceae bacterium]|nr:DUF58 domain-containing protein [Muribaculaceae bacterium]
MKNRVIFVLFLGIVSIFYLMSESDYTRLILGASIVMGVLLLLQMLYLKTHLQGRIRLSENLVTRCDSIRIPVQVKNTGKLPVTRITAWIRYEDSGSGVWDRMKLSGMAEAGGEVWLEAELKTCHCGIVRFYLEKLTVSDYFGIFSGRCRVDSIQKEVYVLPWVNAITEDTLGNMGDFEGKYGADVYETYDIREFRNGDDMRQIHWKLTAKTDILLVREYLKTSESGVMVGLDFQKEKERELSREELDVFLDKASSLSWEILQWGVSHYAIWDRDGERVIFYIENEEKFTEYQMILTGAAVCKRAVESAWTKEKDIDETKLHAVWMDLDGKVCWKESEETQ